MQITGELIGNRIIVKKPKDVGRLYDKSGFGKPITDNQLELNLLEGVFLLGDKKINVYSKKNEVNFRDLIKLAAEKITGFESKYLVFRDLRYRGYAVNIYDGKDYDLYIDSKDESNPHYVSVFSERFEFDVVKTKNSIKVSKEKDGDLWFAIVDEEGDITYYDVSLLELKGNIKKHKFSKDTGILLENRVVIFNEKLAITLLDKEFFGKPFGNGLQLSLVEALYLMEKGIIDIRERAIGGKLTLKKFKEVVSKSQPDIDHRFFVFKDLKKRGLIVKTGFKFGVHFRAYTKKPDVTHAEYLLHVVGKNYKSIWAEISRAVRLAHSVNKEIVFARIDGEKIDYIRLGRLRP